MFPRPNTMILEPTSSLDLGYWKGSEAQRAVGNDRPYHYLGSGKTYYLKGQAFGNAMLQLMQR